MKLVLIVLLGILLRAAFVVGENTSDDFVHLWNVRLRRKLNNPWQHDVDDSIIQGKRGYPCLYHYLISLFPEKWWVVAGRMSNIFFDAVTIIATYFVAEAFFSHMGYDKILGHVWSPALSATLVMATTPMLMPITSRMRALGARPLGTFLSLFYTLCLGVGMLFSPLLGVFGCVALALVIVLSSQFATQNMIFQSVFIGLIYASPVPFLVLIATGVLAWVFPQLGIRDTLDFEYEHTKWYRTNAAKGTTAAGRNRLSDLLCLPFYIIARPKTALLIIFKKSSLLIAIYSLPPLVATTYFLIQAGTVDSLRTNPFIQFAACVVIVGVFVFLLTSLPPLLFLGQAERYFEYTMPFISILFVYEVITGSHGFSWIFYIVLIQTIVTLINLLGGNRQRIEELSSQRDESSFAELLGFLESEPAHRILTVPTKIAFRLSCRLSEKHSFYYRAINESGKGRGFKYKNEDYGWFELLKPNMEYFRDKYGADAVVVHKPTLEQPKAREMGYNFLSHNKIFENDEYVVFTLS